MIRTLTFTTALVLTAGSAAAQGFTGATLGIDYTKSFDTDDLGGITYYGQAQFEAMAGVSFALDVTAYDFAIAGSDAQNLTGHAIYALDPYISIGAYFGRDWVDDDSINTYGVQGAYDYGFGTAQAYAGLGDGAFEEIFIVGGAANYEFTGGISAIGAVDRVSFDGGTGLAFELGGEYALENGPVFSGVLGRVALEENNASNDEIYIGVKARIDLGLDGGTTFDRRGFFEAFRAAGN